MLDYHPYVSCSIKILSRRGPQTNEQINKNGMTTWNGMRAAYNIVFMVDSVFVCADKNISVAHCFDTLADFFTLLQYLIDVHINDAPYPLFVIQS